MSGRERELGVGRGWGVAVAVAGVGSCRTMEVVGCRLISQIPF